MAFLKQMDKSPKVQRENTLRISELAQRLTLELDAGAYSGGGAAPSWGWRYSTWRSTWTRPGACPQREHPMPPPEGWDSRYAACMIRDAMYAFTIDCLLTPPREHEQEIRAWRTALELSLAILEIGERRDPERWLDLMVKGADPVTGHVAGGAAMRNPGFDDAGGGIRSLVENTTPHPQGRVLGPGPESRYENQEP